MLHELGHGHPVSCVDCHDPDSMKIRVTRPGFLQGIAVLAEGDAPVPHLASIERWRQGPRAKPYDPNTEASRTEMRSQWNLLSSSSIAPSLFVRAIPLTVSNEASRHSLTRLIVPSWNTL